jgi:hypothetical protein
MFSHSYNIPLNNGAAKQRHATGMPTMVVLCTFFHATNSGEKVGTPLIQCPNEHIYYKL